MIALAHHSSPPGPNDPDVVATAQFLDDAVREIDALYYETARWLLGTSTTHGGSADTP